MIPGRLKLNERSLTVNKQYIFLLLHPEYLSVESFNYECCMA